MQRNHWLDKRNQKIFLDEIAKKLVIKSPSDWGKVKKRDVLLLGGNTILQRYYNGSIKSALQSVYPGMLFWHPKFTLEIRWERNWFENVRENPSDYWKSEQNQRKFLDGLQKKLNIQSPRDWGNITIQNVIDNGGSGLLNHYNSSLFQALQRIYPGTLLVR